MRVGLYNLRQNFHMSSVVKYALKFGWKVWCLPRTPRWTHLAACDIHAIFRPKSSGRRYILMKRSLVRIDAYCLPWHTIPLFDEKNAGMLVSVSPRGVKMHLSNQAIAMQSRTFKITQRWSWPLSWFVNPWRARRALNLGKWKRNCLSDCLDHHSSCHVTNVWHVFQLTSIWNGKYPQI